MSNFRSAVYKNTIFSINSKVGLYFTKIHYDILPTPIVYIIHNTIFL